MIPEILKVANKLEEQKQLKLRSKVARTAKKIGLDINYTQCKRIAYIYYGVGLLNYLLVESGKILGDETLESYMKRTYHKYEQPYQFMPI